GMENSVSEIDPPETGEGTIRTLPASQEADTVSHRSMDPDAQDRWIGGPEETQGAQRRTGTLDVRPLGHALAKHFGWVDALQQSQSAAPLVGAEAAVAVLAAQDEPRRCEQALVGYALARNPGQARRAVDGKDRVQRLGGAIAHRPTMHPVGKTPASLHRV